MDLELKDEFKDASFKEVSPGARKENLILGPREVHFFLRLEAEKGGGGNEEYLQWLEMTYKEFWDDGVRKAELRKEFRKDYAMKDESYFAHRGLEGFFEFLFYLYVKYREILPIIMDRVFQEFQRIRDWWGKQTYPKDSLLDSLEDKLLLQFNDSNKGDNESKINGLIEQIVPFMFPGQTNEKTAKMTIQISRQNKVLVEEDVGEEGEEDVEEDVEEDGEEEGEEEKKYKGPWNCGYCGKLKISADKDKCPRCGAKRGRKPTPENIEKDKKTARKVKRARLIRLSARQPQWKEDRKKLSKNRFARWLTSESKGGIMFTKKKKKKKKKKEKKEKKKKKK